MTHFIYILHSVNSDLFYVGYTTDFNKRLDQHNHSLNVTFTSKHRPWTCFALFKVNGTKSEALKIERFIKKQKSKSFIQKLAEPHFIPKGHLALLVRVPYLRD